MNCNTYLWVKVSWSRKDSAWNLSKNAPRCRAFETCRLLLLQTGTFDGSYTHRAPGASAGGRAGRRRRGQKEGDAAACLPARWEQGRPTQRGTSQAASWQGSMAGLQDFHQGSQCHGKTWIGVLLGVIQLLIPFVQRGEAQLQGLFYTFILLFWEEVVIITTVCSNETDAKKRKTLATWMKTLNFKYGYIAQKKRMFKCAKNIWSSFLWPNESKCWFLPTCKVLWLMFTVR